MALWEQWLGEAAAATKQRCGHYTSQTLKLIPGLTPPEGVRELVVLLVLANLVPRRGGETRVR